MRFDFGDLRLDKRANHMMKTMCAPKESITETFYSWKETMAAYRFFDNEKVTPEKILKPHIQETYERIKKHERILLIQDTTAVVYKKHVEGMGLIATEDQHGFLLHALLALTPERVNLGRVHVKHWNS